jgi:hypothetical protein
MEAMIDKQRDAMSIIDEQPGPWQLVGSVRSFGSHHVLAIEDVNGTWVMAGGCHEVNDCGRNVFRAGEIAFQSPAAMSMILAAPDTKRERDELLEAIKKERAFSAHEHAERLDACAMAAKAHERAQEYLEQRNRLLSVLKVVLNLDGLSDCDTRVMYARALIDQIEKGPNV